MRFLIDVCASSRTLQEALIGLGQEVQSVYEVNPKATDEELLELAHREGRILVTLDNDFGELVFVRRLPRPAVIRFDEMPLDEQVAAMRELVARHADDLEQKAFVVVTRGRIRIRR